jgi:hypothetical protein
MGRRLNQWQLLFRCWTTVGWIAGSIARADCCTALHLTMAVVVAIGARSLQAGYPIAHSYV